MGALEEVEDVDWCPWPFRSSPCSPIDCASEAVEGVGLWLVLLLNNEKAEVVRE